MSAKRKKRSKRSTQLARPRKIDLAKTVEEVVTTWADRELRRLFGLEVTPKPAPLPRQVINVTPRKP